MKRQVVISLNMDFYEKIKKESKNLGVPISLYLRAILEKNYEEFKKSELYLNLLKYLVENRDNIDENFLKKLKKIWEG